LRAAASRILMSIPCGGTPCVAGHFFVWTFGTGIAAVQLVWQPSIRKSVVLDILSVVLLMTFMNPLLVAPYSSATAQLPSSETLCRQHKIRCNRETPCSNCIRSRHSAIGYATLPVLPHRSRERNRDEASSTTTSIAASILGMYSMKNQVTLLKNS
jgi:hypothetical protein